MGHPLTEHDKAIPSKHRRKHRGEKATKWPIGNKRRDGDGRSYGGETVHESNRHLEGTVKGPQLRTGIAGGQCMSGWNLESQLGNSGLS